MGRPKIKTIESAVDLEKVQLPKETELPETETNLPEELTPKKAKTLAKKSANVAKKNKLSKRYSEISKLTDKSKSYPINEAVNLIKKTATTRFDSTIEAHINLTIDPSKQEQQIRTTTTLPKGTGKKINVIVFGAKDTKILKEIGAQIGEDDTLTQIEKGKINFEKIVASPDWMSKLARVAKVLGPKGLMPNPKSGTVSEEPEKVAVGLSSGLVEIKTETSPIIHITIGKASFQEKDLEENLQSLLSAVKGAKPADFKKEIIKSVYLTSTMGPSVKIDLSQTNT